MSNIKKLSLVLVLLGLFFGVSACQAKPDKGDLVSVSVSLYNDTLLYKGDFEIEENSSAYELLVEFFEGTYSEYVMEGETVYMLDTLKYQTYDLVPQSQEFIAFYVNGESSMKGISQYYIQDNDSIEFRIESWS
ncbi:MAG: DUF4430 domain-containing protein [Acholeplasma sp.]|nr:DUF4430 domain-containing protein [Acholeplasma sp.]